MHKTTQALLTAMAEATPADMARPFEEGSTVSLPLGRWIASGCPDATVVEHALPLVQPESSGSSLILLSYIPYMEQDRFCGWWPSTPDGRKAAMLEGTTRSAADPDAVYCLYELRAGQRFDLESDASQVVGRWPAPKPTTPASNHDPLGNAFWAHSGTDLPRDTIATYTRTNRPSDE